MHHIDRILTERVNYDAPNDLEYLMTRLGSDKGTPHRYTAIYKELFEPIRHEPLNIFEMGIGTNDLTIPDNMGVFARPGASLYAWERYFPNSKIYGADIDERILINENNIKSYYCDMTETKSVRHMWDVDMKDVVFDIMIDDGLHTSVANYTLMINSLYKLKKGGYYIVEDLNETRVQLFTTISSNIQRMFGLEYFRVIPGTTISKRAPSNSGLIIIKK